MRWAFLLGFTECFFHFRTYVPPPVALYSRFKHSSHNFLPSISNLAIFLGLHLTQSICAMRNWIRFWHIIISFFLCTVHFCTHGIIVCCSLCSTSPKLSLLSNQFTTQILLCILSPFLTKLSSMTLPLIKQSRYSNRAINHIRPCCPQQRSLLCKKTNFQLPKNELRI